MILTRLEGEKTSSRELSTVPNGNGKSLRPLPNRLFIPTSPKAKAGDWTKGLKVNLHVGGEKIARHLLWYLIFKGCSVIEWFLLFEFLSRNIKGSSRFLCECLAGVLIESSSTRKGLLNFKSLLKPIHKKLRAYTHIGDINFKGVTLLDIVVLELKIPQKGLPRNRLLTVHEGITFSTRPSVPTRIGVGYKDKGSMGIDFVETVNPDEVMGDPLMVESLPLSRAWQNIVTNFSKIEES